MILKYKTETERAESWYMADGISSLSVELYNYETALNEYNKDEADRVIVPNNHDKVYLYISQLPIENFFLRRENKRSVNAIDDNCAHNYVRRILCELDGKTNEVLELITTNDCYVLNDSGKTIEKL